MLDIRRLKEADLDASWRLGRLAFGSTQQTPPPRRPELESCLVRWGGFDESQRLVAKATDLLHDQWWGGRVVPASGVAGVATEPEQRGRGVTTSVMTALLEGARERGAVVAALFCTSTAVYRSLGFEACGVMREVDVPTALLPRAAAPAGVRLRPAEAGDLTAVRGVYDEIARTGNGMLARRGGLFSDPPDATLPDGIDGITLAEDATGALVGYASWQRGRGYDDSSVITVPDCLALTGDAAGALLATLGGWVSVAPTVRFRLPAWADAVTARLPLERAREHRVDVWMHRPLDVARAVAARGWPTGVAGSVEFRLVDPLLTGNDGAWRLTLAGGSGRLEPATGEPAATLDVRGWSLLWCGSARTAQVRQAGFLHGGHAGDDAGLDALLGCGGPSGLLDYF
jgi:predicted acetyltransferase